MANTTKQKLGPKQRAWVKALRSGKYKQGTGALIVYNNDNKKHCCLGVLCEMNNLLTTNGYVKGTGNNSYLPKTLMKKLHFRADSGDFKTIQKIVNNRYDSLVSANDGGVSFNTIATFIEENPNEVFTKPA